MPAAPTHEPNGTCRSCPVCLLIAAVSELQPEAAAHLAAAGRELALAVRAVVADADVYGHHRRGRSGDTSGDRTDGADGRTAADTTLRRIVVDGADPVDPSRDS
jgi:hypothetical protein